MKGVERAKGRAIYGGKLRVFSMVKMRQGQDLGSCGPTESTAEREQGQVGCGREMGVIQERVSQFITEIIDEDNMMRVEGDSGQLAPFNMTGLVSSIRGSPYALCNLRDCGSSNRVMLNWLTSPDPSSAPSARTEPERPQPEQQCETTLYASPCHSWFNTDCPQIDSTRFKQRGLKVVLRADALNPSR